MKNYYKVLGITSNATTEDIKKAYKQLIEQYHPTMNSGDKYAEERFIDISVAYKTLSNKAKRDDYNTILNSIRPISHFSEQHVRHEEKTHHFQAIAPAMQDIKYSQNKYLVYIALLLTATAFSAAFLSIIIKERQTNASSHIATIKVQSPASNTVTPAVNIQHEHTPTSQVTTTVLHSNDEIDKKIGKTSTHQKGTIFTPVSNTHHIHLSTDESSGQIVVSTLPAEYTIGATRNDILRIQGSPNSIVRYDNEDEVWLYGSSKLHFSNGKLSSYRNNDKNLLIQHF